MHRVLILAISALLLGAPLAAQDLASVGRLYQQGQLSAAAEAARAALSQHPEQAELHLLLGRIIADQGKHREALTSRMRSRSTASP